MRSSSNPIAVVDCVGVTSDSWGWRSSSSNWKMLVLQDRKDRAGIEQKTWLKHQMWHPIASVVVAQVASAQRALGSSSACLGRAACPSPALERRVVVSSEMVSFANVLYFYGTGNASSRSSTHTTAPVDFEEGEALVAVIFSVVFSRVCASVFLCHCL